MIQLRSVSGQILDADALRGAGRFDVVVKDSEPMDPFSLGACGVPEHTSGDTIVYLPDKKIVFGGDLLVTNRPDTGIHMEKNGSTAGWIENAKSILGLDADTYLTGYRDMVAKADVQKKLELIQGKYGKN